GRSRMKRSSAGRYYLTFEGKDLHQAYPSTDEWLNYARLTVEKALSTAKRATACKVLAGPSLWRTALEVPAGAGEFGRRICPIVFDEMPGEGWRAAVNQREQITDHGGVAPDGP